MDDEKNQHFTNFAETFDAATFADELQSKTKNQEIKAALLIFFASENKEAANSAYRSCINQMILQMTQTEKDEMLLTLCQMPKAQSTEPVGIAYILKTLVNIIDKASDE